MDTSAQRTAVAYYRTSSASNVGPEKDSLERQKLAVQACAQARGVPIVREFYDAAVSGADPIDSREGFAAMLAYMLGNGARTIIVENASRFARDLIVQETGYQALKVKGIELIAADAPDSFLSDTPTAVLIRQILGAVHQFDKAMVVNKLSGARARKRRQTARTDSQHRCEGNPAFKPLPVDHIEAACKLYAAGKSLREIASKLAEQGMVNHAGKRYGAGSISRMIRSEQPLPAST